MHFSATQVDRVSALIPINSYAHYLQEDDYPWGVPREGLDGLEAFIRESWGTGAMVELVAASRVADDRFRSWSARSQRVTAGPDLTADISRANFEADFRPLLSSILAPTLVLHREGNRYIHLGAGRYWPSTAPMPSSWSWPATTMR
jgi:hypothetical protein